MVGVNDVIVRISDVVSDVIVESHSEEVSNVIETSETCQ